MVFGVLLQFKNQNSSQSLAKKVKKKVLPDKWTILRNMVIFLCTFIYCLCDVVLQDDNTASLSANSVKLSYAQMVQKTKVAEVSANSLADQSDESESEDPESTQAPNRALKEQGQHPAQSSSKPSTRGSGKDFSRKDSRENESDSRRDDKDMRKENDYRREEPREQRNRRLKENRGDRRYGGDREFSHRNDRRGRDGPQVRERDAPKPAAAVAK